jgi:hypothetical protein
MQPKTKIILLIIGSIFVILLLVWIFYPTKNKKNPIPVDPNDYNKCRDCCKKQTFCTNPNDCAKCLETQIDGVEYTCQKLNPQDPNSLKVCLPEDAKPSCNYAHGAIDVWGGYDSPPRMEWDCMCSNGDWAAGVDKNGKTICNINPDICQGGTFTWDSKKDPKPNADMCTCTRKNSAEELSDCLTECTKVGGADENECEATCKKLASYYQYGKLVSSTGKPICVPKDVETTKFYTKNGYTLGYKPGPVLPPWTPPTNL